MNANKRTPSNLWRAATFGSTGILVAVTALLVLAPITSAASANYLIPRGKLTAGTQFDISKAACGKAKQTKAPHWSASTGNFLTAGSATAPVCKPSASENSASWSGSVSFISLLKFKASGNYTITLAWQIAESALWNATPYSSCALNYNAAFSTCLVSAESEIFGYAYLFDENNGSYFNFGTYVQLYNFTTVQNYSENYCSGAVCTIYSGNTSSGNNSAFSGTVFASSVLSATGSNAVVKGDTYELEAYLSVEAYADAYTENAHSTGSASATASTNTGTHGEYARLTSVTVA
jgi:hypothetical protein